MSYASESTFGPDNLSSQWPQGDAADSRWGSNDEIWQSGRNNDFFSPPGAASAGYTQWSLGQELLLHDSGELTAASAAAPSSPASAATGTQAIAPTLVGHAGGLQFNLIWDSSVGAAPVRVEHAMIAAAKYYSNHYSNDEVINIHVGFGEIGGSSMSSNALGESESYGYMTNYNVVDSALQRDASSSSYQRSADATLTSANPTGAGQFFVTSADAKTLGLINGASTALDGYIGLSSAYPMDYYTNFGGNHIGPNQYDAIGVAKHEISEVMGRVGSVGAVMGANVYTPLDLFRYAANGVHDLTPAAGYFSVDHGATNLGVYNNPRNGGDAADWTSSLIGDSYGDGYAGHRAPVSPTDIIENAVLGYTMTPAALAATHTLGLA
jgi:hypothetical protein